MTKILIMGLPGSGKTTLANDLSKKLNCNIYNADEIRKKYNDWDFSDDGRKRQALRMSLLCSEDLKLGNKYVIADFVCPTKEARLLFNPDIIIWVDTINKSIYEDTNKIFEEPEDYNFRVNRQDSEYCSEYIYNFIYQKKEKSKFDWKNPTAQMLGRYQPWHQGHRALFEECLSRVGQVCIMIRDTAGTNSSNPFDTNTVISNIKKDLDFEYQGKYIITVVPNITNIYYGRDVGYSVEKISLAENLQSISATSIRKEMGL